ncbi:MAG: heavy-metal-associated domain-containing protein, partial [Rhodobacter sp.]|nr:heavy-metal-associated domain-containing protein [Rhodobacter sp.]
MNSQQTLTFQIEGLSCAGCVGRAEKALAAVDGVDLATVNLAAESAQVTFSSPADSGALSDALAKAGYP